MAFLYGRPGRLTAKNGGFPARADIREQPARRENLDGVTIIVEYLVEISSHYPVAAVSLNEGAYSLEPPTPRGVPRERDIMDDTDDDGGENQEEDVMAGFHALIAAQTQQCLAVLGNLVRSLPHLMGTKRF